MASPTGRAPRLPFLYQRIMNPRPGRTTAPITEAEYAELEERVLHHTHELSGRNGIWMVWCYEHCWAWRPAVVDDFGTLVRIHTGRAAHSLS